ncbi:hypothetical protein BCR36DRAFT_397293 [Piromyces finnis]|uniref:Uncharacterized protein n=1 Tax=Piromyces finnis TaxID=1754191 RepID=A0A1Y1VCB3_9FUNG|nr:hypothetical protein BCR36DRAFT_397293 [Piromyces finnis]|eukprot:ORX51092.1 hypothetical protein BCR36DRAFT_397293 [Piromyces finnis]
MIMIMIMINVLSSSDKFHADCYSYNSMICKTHYLLRKAPFHVMWVGDYVLIDDRIERFTNSEEKLLGISISKGLEEFELNNDNLSSKPYYEKVKFIGENHDLWENIPFEEDPFEYFDYDTTNSVKYDGYLVNHTKKQAIDLKDYYEKSVSYKDEEEGLYRFLIDLIPPLTETGRGTEMALFYGCSADVTEELIGSWCGDLLQIVDDLPEDYKKLTCCFATAFERGIYYKTKYGLDDDNCILKNNNKDRYEVTRKKIHFFYLFV